tara:strand:+ start:137 stop:1234 length:1098 start_codon:yes stop_codon:yes gene_type:complete
MRRQEEIERRRAAARARRRETTSRETPPENRGAERTDSTSSVPLRYPNAMLDNMDFLRIQVYKYEKTGLSNLFGNPTGDLNAEGVIAKPELKKTSGEGDNIKKEFAIAKGSLRIDRARKRLKTVLKTIFLPIPRQVGDVTSINWGDGSSLNALEAFGLQFGRQFLDDPGNAFNFLQNTLATQAAEFNTAGTQDIFKSAISGAAVQAVGGNVTPSSIVARATGQIFNPNLELLFSGVNLRAFPFEFEFFPRDADESKKVLEIIRCFKYYAAPQLGSEEGFAGAFISSPDVFQLTYMSGKGKPHPFLNNFMPMALVETKVNYSGSGTFATFHDGTPTHIKLSLTFKELNPVYREDYDEGIGKNGVGY